MLKKHPSVQIAAAFTLSVLAACSNVPTVPSAAAPEVENAGSLETLVILGTNDIHGGLVPQDLKTREPEGTAPTAYKAGGAAMLAGLIHELRAEYGPHLIWLDAGDEFQGSIESNLSHGSPMVSFFNLNGLDAAAIGNHEFDFGPEQNALHPDYASDLNGALKSRMEEAHYPYLSANIHVKGSHAAPGFPNYKPYALLQAGGLKVGVIGLSTLQTPTTTRAEYVKDLTFDDLKTATLDASKALRAQGAEIIVIDAHAGEKCEPGHAKQGDVVRKATDPQGNCGANDEIVKLLNSLPEGTVDAVVSGHTHQVVHHWINGVPVIEGGAFGRYTNLIYLTYDKAQGKILNEKTRIQGPIPICEKVFQHQNDCNGDRPAPKEGRGKLVNLRFHGKTIQPDHATEQLLEPVVAQSAAKKNEIVGQAERPVEHERFKESPLGNLVADAIRAAAKADVAIMNSGGIRAAIEAGPISYGEIFRALPFDNSISVLKMTGRELKLLLRVAESGSRGFPSVSGVKLTLIDPAADAPSSDLNGDGKISLWEINRLLNATLEDGSPIVDNHVYTLATLDFLVTGGDDFGWPMSKIPADRINIGIGLTQRDAVVAYLKTQGSINPAKKPLVDPANPRLKFEMPKMKAKGRRGRRRRGHQGRHGKKTHPKAGT